MSGEIVRQEFEHDLLFWMPSCLLPQSVNEFDFSERKIQQTARCWVTVVSRHILIPCHDFGLRFLNIREYVNRDKEISSDRNYTHNGLRRVKPEEYPQGSSIGPRHLPTTRFSRRGKKNLLALAKVRPNNVTIPDTVSNSKRSR